MQSQYKSGWNITSFASKLKNYPPKEGWRGGLQVAFSCPASPFCRKSATLFVGRILQWWISYCRWQMDNEQRGVGGRDVIKTSSHITIRLPLPPLRLFPSPPPLPLLLPSFFSFFFFFVFSSDETAFSGCMANENDGETDKKRKKEGRERGKKKSGFEVLCHISRRLPSDLPIWANNMLTWRCAELRLFTETRVQLTEK